MIADPATFPVTSPLALTAATVALLLDQVIARPGSGLPFASLGVAVSCTVLPASTDADAGATSTEATGAGGVLPENVTLQTMWVPVAAYNVQSPSDVTVLCSVRKA